MLVSWRHINTPMESCAPDKKPICNNEHQPHLENTVLLHPSQSALRNDTVSFLSDGISDHNTSLRAGVSVPIPPK